MQSSLLSSPARRYTGAVLFACVAALLQFALRWLLRSGEDPGSYQFFLAAVALSAVVLGRRPSFLTLAVCSMLKLYFFLPPYNSFAVTSPVVLVRLALFVALGIVISLVGGALHGSQATLSSMLGNIADAVVATNDQNVVQYMNPAAESLTGWTGEDGVGRPIQQVLQLADRDTLVQKDFPIDSALRQGGVTHLSENDLLVSKSGRTVPVEASIAPVLGPFRQVYGAVVVFRDISEQRRQKQALRDSESRYRFLVDAVPEFIFTTDSAGQWDYCNQRWCDYTGLTPEQSAGRNWIAAVHSDDASAAAAGWAEAVRTGELYEAEYRVRNHEGNYRWFLSRGIPMRNDQGRIERWFGICADINDFKRSQEQLSQALKMEALGRLAGGVAHDFNNLLMVINGYAKMLSESPEKQGSSSREAQQILYAAERGSALTRQLLTFSRQEVVRPSIIDLNSVVGKMQPMIQRLIGEDILIRTVLNSALHPVRIDQGQIEQVILNLAANARDAMPVGGQFTIETANVDLDAPYVKDHLNVEPGLYAALIVSDTGSGIDKEIQSHIFEPFFTTKDAGKGTGLGLSTVFGIVSQCGGQIFVYSEPGIGTTFKIYLPAVPPEEPPGKKADLPRRELTRGTATVLVLEDEPSVRKLVQTMLVDQGFTVLEAGNHVEALRLCSEHPEPIDLLVTDVVMPEMGGRQVAEKALQYRPGMKVLYMSGYTGDAITRRGVLGAGVAFLQKPFSSDLLLQTIIELLNG